MTPVLNKFLKTIFGPIFIAMLVACGDTSTSSSSDDGDSSSSASASSDLIGTWSLDSAQAQGGNVTISFQSNGRGENSIDVPGFAQETRGYSYRESGDLIYFTYDEVGSEGSPSRIIELTSTTLRILNPDNSTGIYTRVGTGGTSSDDSSSSTTGTAGISVWGSNSSFGSVKVYIDGTFRGTLGNFFTLSPPSFGDSRTVTVTGLRPGTHYIEADSGSTGAEWGPFSVNLQAGDQLLFELR